MGIIHGFCGGGEPVSLALVREQVFGGGNHLIMIPGGDQQNRAATVPQGLGQAP
jgi:hypothetical protein